MHLYSVCDLCYHLNCLLILLVGSNTEYMLCSFFTLCMCILCIVLSTEVGVSVDKHGLEWQERSGAH